MSHADIIAHLRTAILLGFKQEAIAFCSVLESFLNPRPESGVLPTPRVHHIIDVVAAVYGIDLAELFGIGRTPMVVRARRACTILCREWTRCSYPEIAWAMHRKSHSTVMEHMRHEEEKATDEYIKVEKWLSERFSRRAF